MELGPVALEWSSGSLSLALRRWLEERELTEVPHTFSDYSDRYEHVAMEREDGVLVLRFHSDGGPLIWGAKPHRELGFCFTDVGRDPENRVIIVTGTGDKFIADLDTSWVGPMSAAKWDTIYRAGKRLLNSYAEIEVPIISAINGLATVHAELGLMADIVLAAESATFSDAPHFKYGAVPGDGVHVIWPLLLGMNRARYFLLTGQHITAQEALGLGVVNEVLSSSDLLERAREHAHNLCRQPDITLRYTRVVLNEALRKTLSDSVGYGLALEGLAAHETWPS